MSRHEWVKHMEEDHEHETFYWECSLCDDAAHFDSGQTFASHLTDIHADAVTDLSSFVDICSKPKILHGVCCPLCTFTDSGEDISGELLLAHVAEHVHSFSLSSLPLLSNDDTGGERSLYFQNNAYFGDSDANASVASCGTDMEEAEPALERQELLEEVRSYDHIDQEHDLVSASAKLVPQDNMEQLTASALGDLSVSLHSSEQCAGTWSTRIDGWFSEIRGGVGDQDWVQKVRVSLKGWEALTCLGTQS